MTERIDELKAIIKQFDPDYLEDAQDTDLEDLDRLLDRLYSVSQTEGEALILKEVGNMTPSPSVTPT